MLMDCKKGDLLMSCQQRKSRRMAIHYSLYYFGPHFEDQGSEGLAYLGWILGIINWIDLVTMKERIYLFKVLSNGYENQFRKYM